MGTGNDDAREEFVGAVCIADTGNTLTAHLGRWVEQQDSFHLQCLELQVLWVVLMRSQLHDNNARDVRETKGNDSKLFIISLRR